MTKEEQIRIINELTEGVRKSMVALVQKDIIPESWDGIELRELFVVRAKGCSWPSLTGRRKKNFYNAVLVKYLDSRMED